MCSLIFAAVLSSPEAIDRQRDQLRAAFVEQLTLLAGSPVVGEAARELMTPFKPLGRRLDDLPVRARPDLLSYPEDVREEWRRLEELRNEHASALFLLSRRAAKEGLALMSFRLVEEAAAADPDYAPARTRLGYERIGSVWQTPHQARMDRKEMVWHDRFGWLPQKHVPRYEAGERFVRGRWVGAETAQKAHSRFANAWEVETEHFVVKSNTSLERAAGLAGKLEDFRTFFRRDYAALFDSPRQIGSLLDGPRLRRRKRHEVHDFSTREEYVRRLSPKMPGVEASNGVYLTADRVAYFFRPESADAEDNAGAGLSVETLYHEVTHQLLYEAESADRPIAAAAHFWPVEGFACYLESFQTDGSVVSVGDLNHDRVYWARRRLLKEGYQVPLEEFSALGMRAFQRASSLEEIQRRYSQASGLCHFFLHYEGGRYREAFLEHLRQIYGPPRKGVQALWTLTGMPAAALDQQYRSYMAELDEQAARPVADNERDAAP